MPGLIWMPEALRDVERIYGFLSEKDHDAARRAIRQGVRTLGQHPEIGRPVAGLEPEFREWVIPFGAGGYIVLYRIEPDLVVLLAAWHGARSDMGCEPPAWSNQRFAG